MPSYQPPPVDMAPPPRVYDHCDTLHEPTRVSVTCLGAGSAYDVPTVRGWFKRVQPSWVEVQLLEGKRGKRLACFTLTRERWPAWNQVVGGATGEEACRRLGQRLLDDDVGRPLAERLESDSHGAHYEYGILDTWSPRNYPTQKRLGDLDEATAPDGLDKIRRWLAGDAVEELPAQVAPPPLPPQAPQQQVMPLIPMAE